MSRERRRKIKQELPETSTSFSRQQTEHDLAYYIHDRVELMHQVFSILKPKDLKAMAPECVRHISTKDLQELCTEELLGISSKRLLSILDGADPPSDTESSSDSPPLETISLDSISSDDEILSQSSKKKKHKHRRRDSKSKSKKKKSSPTADNATVEGSLSSRAGLTVLELLELQARARAIRAQLQQDKGAVEQAAVPLARSVRPSRSSCDSEVEIKEEPAEVVEISDDEKPDPGELQAALEAASSKPPETTEQPATLTKKVNDLTITVPQSKQTRKIKLNRNKVTVSVPNEEANKEPQRTVTETTEATQNGKNKKKTEKQKKKKKQKKNDVDKDNSDHDEITLQLSDSEKMDLLEDFDRKQYDVVTSSSSEDSESSSDDSDEETDDDDKNDDSKVGSSEKSVTDKTAEVSKDVNSGISDMSKEMSSKDISLDATAASAVLDVEDLSVCDKSNKSDTDVNNTDLVVSDITESKDKEIENVEETIVVNSVEDIPVIEKPALGYTELQVQKEHANFDNTQVDVDNVVQSDVTSEKAKDSLPEKATDSVKENSATANVLDEQNEKSEGEMSDRESSEVEASDLKPEVVCISDDDGNAKKKKKKKDKKSKKSKKSKKKDFREASDQNFYEDATNKAKQATIDLDDDDDVYEFLEILSDDSSCYEVEGTVLSKEPTAEEIEALSAKIDEIEKQEVVDIQVADYAESVEQASRDRHSESSEGIENISWKDRYLGSKKVKRVLSTANILNALRKKNKELKKKMEESKKAEAVFETETTAVEEKEVETKSLEEGSIEHYNTLEGSTKFVDPVKETTDDDKTEKGEKVEIEPIQITGEMKKDAKQLLKMYKRLLKQCKAKGEEKTKDTNKKKKKKIKSKKDTAEVTNNV